MFRRSYLIGVAALLVAAGVLGWQMTRISDADHDAYHALVASTKTEPTLQRGEPGQQHRRLVYKDLWIASDSGRLHYRIGCETSTLEVLIAGRNPEVVEHMAQVRGMMQESLFWILPDGREVVADGPGRFRLRGSSRSFAGTPQEGWAPMQELRYLEAAKASYYYKSNHFVAEEAKLMRLRAKGHELLLTPEGLDPIITGTASSAEFFLAGKGVDFRANHLKATIYGGGGLL